MVSQAVSISGHGKTSAEAYSYVKSAKKRPYQVYRGTDGKIVTVSMVFSILGSIVLIFLFSVSTN